MNRKFLTASAWFAGIALVATACGAAVAKGASTPSSSPSASAAAPAGSNGTAGTVTSSDGTTLVLTPRGAGATQTVTVNTSSSTVVRKTVAASVSDITPNSSVVVNGPKNADGSYTAASITLSPAGTGGTGGTRGGFGGGAGGAGGGRRSPRPGATPGAGAGAPARSFVAGTVSTIQGGILYVKNAAGTVVQVSTSATTTVSKTVDGALSDITVGATVNVVGPKNSNGTYAATSITIGGGGGGFGAPAPVGG
jgi:hypothetical protein